MVSTRWLLGFSWHGWLQKRNCTSAYNVVLTTYKYLQKVTTRGQQWHITEYNWVLAMCMNVCVCVRERLQQIHISSGCKEGFLDSSWLISNYCSTIDIHKTQVDSTPWHTIIIKHWSKSRGGSNKKHQNKEFNAWLVVIETRDIRYYTSSFKLWLH